MTDRNLSLENLHIDFIRLIMRSPDVGEGWRSVALTLHKIALCTISKRPEIYETKTEPGKLWVRLSDRGQILFADGVIHKGITMSKSNSTEYNAAIKDAVIWLVLNNQKYKPEFLAENLAADLLSQ
jgi:hypothetical protein